MEKVPCLEALPFNQVSMNKLQYVKFTVLICVTIIYIHIDASLDYCEGKLSFNKDVFYGIKSAFTSKLLHIKRTFKRF